MLTQIHIRDLVTIEESQLDFTTGCTMITGETGAGKSIFIEAIELALGGRSRPAMIRKGKEKTEISLCFDISGLPHVVDYLVKLDLYQEAPECIIRRVITSDGRSRFYINGSPTSLNIIKELSDYLLHLHAQHEQQVLLKAENQRDMLDRYADHLPLATQVKNLALESKKLNQQIKMLRAKTRERTERSDYLRFQLDELNTVNLKAGEWETIEAEHKRLAHAEELIRHIQSAAQHLVDEENKSVLASLKNIRKIIETTCAIEPKAYEWLNTINTFLIEISDLEAELQNYLEKMELDPDKLQATEMRMSQIFNLARKHKISPQALVPLKQQLTDELTTLNSSDEDLIKLEEQQKNITANYIKLAEKLSKSRQTAAKALEKEITETIRSLSLPHGEFKIMLEKFAASESEQPSSEENLSAHGNEKIIFHIKTNPDQSLQPIAKIISGGELSRLSLAVHLALANRSAIAALVFDEIDTGLSGAPAEKIGKLLRKLGETYQVFCITHQPQVAACGHQHLLVEKYMIENSTHTRLRLLDNKEKTREIARMLGGEKITEKTLAHAREVLQGG